MCLKLLAAIKGALNIGGFSTSAGYWSSISGGKKEIEVDLAIDRADQCINLCEIKFYNEEFTPTKALAESLNRKKTLFSQHTKTKKALFTTLITPHGAKTNSNYASAIDNQISLDTFFDT